MALQITEQFEKFKPAAKQSFPSVTKRKAQKSSKNQAKKARAKQMIRNQKVYNDPPAQKHRNLMIKTSGVSS